MKDITEKLLPLFFVRLEKKLHAYLTNRTNQQFYIKL